MSEEDLKALICPDPEYLTMALPARDVLSSGQRHVEILGPLMTNESTAVHEGFWTRKAG